MALKLLKSCGHWKQRRHSTRKMDVYVHHICSSSSWGSAGGQWLGQYIGKDGFLNCSSTAVLMFSSLLCHSFLFEMLWGLWHVVYLYRWGIASKEAMIRGRNCFPYSPEYSSPTWASPLIQKGDIPSEYLNIHSSTHNFIRGWKKHFSCVLLCL